MKKLNLTESIMSDLDALAREHSDREEFILAALSDKYFNLKKDKDTIEFLNIIFDGAHKDLDMEPTQVTEVLPKSADAGEYIKDFEKSKAPQFKGKSKKKRKEMAIAAFMAANKGKKMTKEEVTEALVDLLSEGQQTFLITADPASKKAAKDAAQKAGAKDPNFYKQIDSMKPGDTITAEDLDLGHEDDEPHMIKSELYKIAKYALELYKMVDKFEGKGEVDFPAWWQSKITKANAMIGSAKHYLEFELTEPAMDQAVAGTEEPMNEGNLGHNELASLEKEGGFWIVTYRTMDGKKTKVFTDEDKARAFMGTVSEANKKLDPVGHEDKDINNDGKVNKTDKYLKNRRVKIGQAIASHKK